MDGDWSVLEKLQNTNPKLQANYKIQIPNYKQVTNYNVQNYKQPLKTLQSLTLD